MCGMGVLLCLVGNELDSEVHSRCVTFCLVSTSVAAKTKRSYAMQLLLNTDYSLSCARQKRRARHPCQGFVAHVRRI